MYWIYPLCMAIASAIINPYIGFFGVFLIAELIIFLAFHIVITTGVNVFTYYKGRDNTGYSKALEISIKKSSIVWVIISIVLFLISSFVLIIVWLLASGTLTGNVTMMTPIDSPDFGNVKYSSLCLLILSIICNLLTVTVIIFKGKRIRQTWDRISAKQVELETVYKLYESKPSFKPNVLFYIFFLIACILGVFNSNIGLISLPLHCCYIFFIIIASIIINVNYRLLKKGTKVSEYILYNMKQGKCYNYLCIGIAIFICIAIVIEEVVLSLYANTNIYGFNSTLSNNILLLLSCFFNIGCVGALIKSIRLI